MAVPPVDRKICILGMRTVIFAIGLLALAGCSDSDPAPVAAPKATPRQGEAASKGESAANTSSSAAQTVDTDPLEDAILDYGIRLLKDDPDMHNSIYKMEWVADGVTDAERERLALLLEIAVYVKNIAQDVIHITWVKDGLDEDEARAVLKLAGVADQSEDTARLIMAMPWFADGADADESWAINAFNNIARQDPGATVRMLELPWLADGLDEYEIRGYQSDWQGDVLQVGPGSAGYGTPLVHRWSG